MSTLFMIPARWTNKLSPRRRSDIWPSSLFTDKMFENFFSGLDLEPLKAVEDRMSEFSPAVDVHEEDGAFIVKCEVPGLEEKEIKLELVDNTLTLSGEKKSEEKREEGGRSYVESRWGRFRRVIPFNTEINEDKVDASMKNGVLTIKVPKTTEVQKGARTVSIRKA